MPSTTLSIDKHIYQQAAEKARIQSLSVSAVARMLLEAYSGGSIQIKAVAPEEPPQLCELPKAEITPAIRKAAHRAYKMKREQLINL